MIPASVYLITKDCEATLAATLASVQGFAEIVVVDSGSGDRTLEIAREAGCRIWEQEWLGFSAQKALALGYCSFDWVLNLDGDEVLSDELREEIVSCIDDDRIDGLDIPIHDYFLGRPPARAGRFNHRVRFFRRTAGAYDTTREVHESITVTGHVARATGAIRHFGESTIAVKVEKNNRYSDLRAREKALEGRKASTLKLALIFPLAFIKSYLLRRGFVNGRRGFISSMVNAFYAFLKEAKLYEANLATMDDKQDP